MLYFWQFVYNQRWREHAWKGRQLAYLWALVIGSNGLWFAGPGLGMYACYHMVMEDSLAVVRP